MPILKSQAGIAPIVLIISLLSLGAVAAGGYYAINLNKTPQPPPIESPSKAANQSQTPSIEQVKEVHEDTLLSMDGVKDVEVGEKDGKPCVVVFTFKETDALEQLENTGLDGYEVKIENDEQTQ